MKTVDVILNIRRLGVLLDLNLMKEDYVVVFDRLTKLASEVVGTPVSLVSLVHSDHQYFQSHVGLPEPWKSRRQTPLSHSFCQHVVASNQPLIVSDAREHELVKDNLAIPDLGVIGYLGMPLTLSDGNSLGSFCVIDDEPRNWTDTEIAIIQEFAEIVTQEFEMRVEIRSHKRTADDLDQLHEQINNIIDELDPRMDKQTFLTKLRNLREMYLQV